MINELRRSSGILPSELILPTVLGPITVQTLTNLEGWRYDLYTIGYPGAEIPLTLGGPPVTLANYTDEKGWIINFGVAFRSPYGTLNFKADNWNFPASPIFFNLLNLGPANANSVYCNLYNPVTLFGPLYAVYYQPSLAIPYARHLEITLNLPLGSPVAATTIFEALIGKIWLADETLFLKSIKRHTAEQMSGRRIDRYV
jgi:hypothetical protein